MQGRKHHLIPASSHTIQAGVFHFHNQAVTTQFCDEAGDTRTPTFGFLRCCSRLVIEVIAQVTVSKPVDGVLARQHSGEEGAILPRYRIELGIAFAILDVAPAQVVQCLDGLTFWLNVCQGFEVTMIGLGADLRVAPEVGHAFAHRHPPPRVALSSLDDLEDFELARIVDRGLNAQYTPLYGFLIKPHLAK